MNWEMFAGVLRHGATYLAGVLTSAGVFDPSQKETIIGVLMGVGGLIWSVVAKKMGWGAKTTATVLAFFVAGGGALVAHSFYYGYGIVHVAEAAMRLLS